VTDTARPSRNRTAPTEPNQSKVDRSNQNRTEPNQTKPNQTVPCPHAGDAARPLFGGPSAHPRRLWGHVRSAPAFTCIDITRRAREDEEERLRRRCVADTLPLLDLLHFFLRDGARLALVPPSCDGHRVLNAVAAISLLKRARGHCEMILHTHENNTTDGAIRCAARSAARRPRRARRSAWWRWRT